MKLRLPTRMSWTDDRSYDVVPTPYWCSECGQQGVPSLRDGAVCLACGEAQHEPFRAGWDESD